MNVLLFMFTEVPKSLEEHRGTPLPPIGSQAQLAKGSLDLPNCPIILAMGKCNYILHNTMLSHSLLVL